jgi:hypothetical protein
MSNFFTRNRNDLDQLKLYTQSNNDSSTYILDKSVQENMSSCYATSNQIYAQSQIARPIDSEGFLDLATKVDIESKLRNQHLELNSSARNNKDYEKFTMSNPSMCNTKENMRNEDSRFIAPIVNFREMYTADYSFTPYLYINPQDALVNNALFLPPTRGGASSRFDAKDDKFKLKPKQFADVSAKPIPIERLLPTKREVVPAYSFSQ